MVDYSALGGIPAVTKREGVISGEGEHTLNGGSRTKESNVISKEKAVKRSGRRGGSGGANRMGGRSSS